MRLTGCSRADGASIPEPYAAGRRDAASAVAFAGNISPRLAWSDASAATKSFALVCHDPDVPSRADDVNRAHREVPADLPRVDFFRWLRVDLPPSVTELVEGDTSHLQGNFVDEFADDVSAIDAGADRVGHTA